MATDQMAAEASSFLELREVSILLVEDNLGLRTHIARMLTPVCGDLFTAENGRVALDLFRKKMPDLVLTDIVMPAMSGFELVRQIKQQRLYPSELPQLPDNLHIP